MLYNFPLEYNPKHLAEVFLEQPLASSRFANKVNLKIFIYKYIYCFNIVLNIL